MRPLIRVCIDAPRAAPVITIPISASQMPPKRAEDRVGDRHVDAGGDDRPSRGRGRGRRRTCVAALRSPVRLQAIARATRPPSIGKAGIRLKTSSSRLIEASQANIASTAGAPSWTRRRRLAELVPAAGERSRAAAQTTKIASVTAGPAERDPRFDPGRVGFAVHPRHAAEDPELDRADPDPVAAWRRRRGRARAAGSSRRSRRRWRRRGVNGVVELARRPQQVFVELGHPEDDQEEDQEPGPVDRDADPADVEKGDRAAAEHRSMVSG